MLQQAVVFVTKPSSEVPRRPSGTGSTRRAIPVVVVLAVLTIPLHAQLRPRGDALRMRAATLGSFDSTQSVVRLGAIPLLQRVIANLEMALAGPARGEFERRAEYVGRLRRRTLQYTRMVYAGRLKEDPTGYACEGDEGDNEYCPPSVTYDADRRVVTFTLHTRHEFHFTTYPGERRAPSWGGPFGVPWGEPSVAHISMSPDSARALARTWEFLVVFKLPDEVESMTPEQDVWSGDGAMHYVAVETAELWAVDGRSGRVLARLPFRR